MAKEKKSFFETPLMRTKIRSSQVSLFPEAALGYLLGPILALLCNGVVNIWLVQYWDKVLGLGTWGQLFETLLPIFSAIIIVIGNILVGRLMERKPTIVGKARPLILLGMPIIAVSLLILFLIPFPAAAQEATVLEGLKNGSVSTEGGLLASIFIAIGYNLFYAIAWPIYYTSHSALVNLSTRDGGKRGLLSTAVMAAQLAAAGVSGMFGGILVDLLGLLPVYTYSDAYRATEAGKALGDIKFTNDFNLVKELTQNQDYVITISREQANAKWTILMIVMVVALVVGCLLEYFFTRERITEEAVITAKASKEKSSEVKKVSMKEQIKICVKDKYWWMIIIFFFLYQFGGMMKNNDMSFFSQAMTGGNTVSSIINTVGAVPTAAGMAIVWPIAAKLNKAKTISLGGIVAFVAAGLSFLVLIPAIAASTPAITGISVASFCIKALGTAPAMYISLALMANVLDHQEAIHGVRTDGFTMAVYGSIMVAMSGICNGIIVGLNSAVPVEAQKFLHTFLSFGVEGICYLAMAILFIGMNVEKFEKLDKVAIVMDQKEKVLAEGGEWVEPEERARLEDEENDRLVVKAALEQMKADCDKKGLDYGAKEKEYLEKHQKDLANKAAKEKEAKEKAAAAFAALPKETKDAIAKREKETLAEFNNIRAEFKKAKVTL